MRIVKGFLLASVAITATLPLQARAEDGQATLTSASAKPIRLAVNDVANPAPVAAAPATADAGAAESEAIVVTGVRGTTARTIADSPVPVDV